MSAAFQALKRNESDKDVAVKTQTSDATAKQNVSLSVYNSDTNRDIMPKYSKSLIPLFTDSAHSLPITCYGMYSVKQAIHLN